MWKKGALIEKLLEKMNEMTKARFELALVRSFAIFRGPDFLAPGLEWFFTKRARMLLFEGELPKYIPFYFYANLVHDLKKLPEIKGAIHYLLYASESFLELGKLSEDLEIESECRWTAEIANDMIRYVTKKRLEDFSKIVRKLKKRTALCPRCKYFEKNEEGYICWKHGELTLPLNWCDEFRPLS